MVQRNKIVDFLDDYLGTENIKDTSTNGLQVQGSATVDRIGLAVDGSLEAYKNAADAGCQMLIVHHGLIWNGLRSITGSSHRHVEFLVRHSLNLYASHLPLDLHPVCGNNIQLAGTLRLKNVRSAFEYQGVSIGYYGTLPKPCSVHEIAVRLQRAIGSKSIILPFGRKSNKSIGIVSGGGSNALVQAISLDLDCFISGEPAHYTHHQALEHGINAIFAGHYHTETVGVKALGKIIEKRFGIKTVFLDIPTLV